MLFRSDWAQFSTSDTSPERLELLNHLLRVTAPGGMVWLTFNRKAMENVQYQAWVELLTKADYRILPLSGLIVPRGQGKRKKPDVSFWSLLFSVGTSSTELTDGRALQLAFEVDRTIRKNARRKKKPASSSGDGHLFTDFDIVDPLNTKRITRDDEALKRILLTQFSSSRGNGARQPIIIDRSNQAILKLFGSDWRILIAFEKLGVITFT